MHPVPSGAGRRRSVRQPGGVLMRKLRLSLDELRVSTFVADPAAGGEGTVNAHQTEPASVGGPCTGSRCTYPVYLCHPALEENEGEKKQKR
jgi:hypothetical protein